MSGIEAFWDNDDHSIVYMLFSGKWTWDDFYIVDQQVIAMEKDGADQIDVIVDLRYSSGLPPNTLLHVKNIADRQSEKIGVNVLVTNSPLVHNLYKVGSKVYPQINRYFCVAESPEEARTIIGEARQSIHQSSSVS